MVIRYRFDQILKDKQQDISIALSSFDYKFLFVMTHTGKRGAADLILSDMQQWQAELNVAALMQPGTPDHDLSFQVHLVSAEDIQKWLQAGNQRSITLDEVEIEKYGSIDTPHQAFYGIVSGDQIHDWWGKHGTRLFTKNIRNILGKTEVNDAIKETAVKNPDLFWYYNNGVTVLTKSIEPHKRNAVRGSAIGTFRFDDVNIINGAQTISSIGSLTDISVDELSKIKIPMRFIKVSNDPDDYLANAITKANNHQNRVLGRDFASQHMEQHRLAKEMIIEGYQYQLLRIDGDVSKSTDVKTIDLDEALNGLACLTNQESVIATLKSQRGKFFENFDGTLYKSVFNPTVSGIKLINTVLHYRVIDRFINNELARIDKNANGRRHLIITHANRVLTAVTLNKTPSIYKSTDKIEPNEGDILGVLSGFFDHVEKYIEDKYPNAYPARFFSNVERVGEMIRYLNQSVNLNK